MDAKRIRDLSANGRYSEALDGIRELEASGCTSAELLVRKAMCLQLLDDNGSLEEVEDTFKAALALNPDSIDALVEYGWFQLNVKDAPRPALELFERALALQRRINTEVLTGLLKCQQELSPEVGLEAGLADLRVSLVDESKIREHTG